MNYLLVMPRGLSTSQDQYFHIFSIGIAYVSASMKKAGHQVFTLNLDYRKGDVFSILKETMARYRIDMVCTGGLSRDWSGLREIIDIARQVNPSVICVVGGGIIGADPVPAMRVLDADIGVIGEGEEVMCELAKALDNERSFEEIEGLIFKTEKNGLTTTPPRTELPNLDDVPFPDYDGFDYAQYVNTTGLAIIMCSRSCTHACTFCFRPTGQKYRQRSIANVMAEIDFQIEKYRPQVLAVADNMFARSRERVSEFCREIKTREIRWGCSLRVSDATHIDMLKEMKDAGCFSVNYGVESADDRVLKSMRKGISVRQIQKALDNTWEARIHLQANFIFGDINETKETLDNTLSFFHREKKRFLFPLDPIIAFPGSVIYKHACETGLIKDREQFLRDNCPVLNLSKLSADEFRGMLSTITELRLRQRVPSGPFRIADVATDGNCRLEYECRRCGRKEEMDMPFWYSEDPACPDCGTVNHLDPFAKASHDAQAFFADLPNDDSVALWGAGGIYCKMMDGYPSLSSPRFTVVDANEAHHGLTLCGKKVCAPKVLATKNIKSVIISALGRKNEIRAALHRDYPSVERVLVPELQIDGTRIVAVLRRI